METRYFFEMFFYFGFMCILQYYLVVFTDNFNQFLIKWDELGALAKGIEDDLARGKIT